jgi:glycosyltransferase involved in cell wall biosynthesis
MHIIPQIGIGGAELQLAALISGSDQKQILHRVLYYNDSSNGTALALYQDAGVDLVRVPRPFSRPLRSIVAMVAAMKDWYPDLVHCWLWGGMFWGRIAAIVAGAHHIVLGHRTTKVFPTSLFRALEWLPSPNVVHIANSHAGARSLSRQVGIKLSKFKVIYNGVDIKRAAVERRATELRRELSIPEGASIVISVGRLAIEKNYRLLLRIARRCKGSIPLVFLIVGSGELEAELKAYCHKLGVGDCVRFLGTRLDIFSLLRSSDIFCMTSYLEGFPNALIEAMAAGVPVIVTRFPGAEDIVDSGVTGILIPPNDEECAYQALQHLASCQAAARKLGNAAKELVAQRFSQDNMVAAYTAFYRNTISKELI